MTLEIETRLLSKLQEFEASQQYIRKAISLSYMATFCETNSRYLSHIINTHKNKSFRNYINGLRINYIIEKLETDPQYRKFKIATLAEECGFSSQNKFAQVFKREMAISPSAFIKNIENKR
ncbi:TPA: helix-turn-helix domain-containing protein [Elizabethkingia anophelis]